ncbi:MAG: hypothetical protein LKG27_05100 [Clostridiaceae bacterium]|jgi:hypothetical protein|nr:hypothetical protein [Clostridiaceae bacterium]
MKKIPPLNNLNPKIYGTRKLVPAKDYAKPVLALTKDEAQEVEQRNKQIEQLKNQITKLESEVLLPDHSPKTKMETYRVLNTLRWEMNGLVEELREYKKVIYENLLKK